MMNPLQAMAMARQANQMGGLGVQSQGAQQMTPQLQQAQMNVASPLKMEAQPARLMEMDKYRYVNAAQDRAQRDKQLLFNALEGREDRQHREALQAQSYQNALNLEGQRQKNVMDAQDRAKRIELETNKQKLEFELEEKKKQAEILQGLNDERYAGLRKPLANVFAKYNRWNGDGEGSKLDARQKLYKERIKRAASVTVPDASVQEYYKANATVLGYTPGTEIDRNSDAYQKVVVDIFRTQFAGEAEKVLKTVDTEIGALDQQITIAYNRSLTELPKLGISLPEADPYTAPAQNQNPLAVTNPMVLPSKIGKGDGGDGGGNAEGNALQASAYDPNSMLYNPQTGQGGIFPAMAQTAYGKIDELLGNDTAQNALTAGGAAGAAYYLSNGLKGDKTTKLNASDYFDENLNREGKPREKTTKVDPKKPLKQTEFRKTSQELVDVEEKLKNKNLSTAERTKLERDQKRLTTKLDNASPTYKKTKVPTTLTDTQFANRKVKVFKDAVSKFGQGESKLSIEKIKSMTPDQLSTHISKLNDGFLKKWSKKLKNSIYLKDEKGDVIRDKSGKPRAFREIPKSIKLGVAGTAGMLAWDYMTAVPAEKKAEMIEEIKSDAQLLNEARQAVIEEMEAEIDSNGTIEINGMQFKKL
jgi:hypothetical protein